MDGPAAAHGSAPPGFGNEDPPAGDLDRAARPGRVFSVDVPPLSVGTPPDLSDVVLRISADVAARYRRLRGWEVLRPVWWDHDGPSVQRRVQDRFGVRWDPAVPHDAVTAIAFEPHGDPGREPVPVSRRTFAELRDRLAAHDEQLVGDLLRRLGVPVDRSPTRRSTDPAVRAASQRAFLRNLARGEAYAATAPTWWDVGSRSAVDQLAVRRHTRQGARYDIAFARPSGGAVLASTTRPELLAACVALVVHPDDERHRPLVGTSVTTALFEVPVPVLAHRSVDPGSGSGIALVCTFGDTTDVTCWRELQLPARVVLGRDGRLLPDPPQGLEADPARSAYAQLAGATPEDARQRVLHLLRTRGHLVGEPRPAYNALPFPEQGDEPLEIILTCQWYLRSGGSDEGLRRRLLARVAELERSPAGPHLRRDWRAGLDGDWPVGRQRPLGVPIPLWYPLDEDGRPVHDRPIVPSEGALPVDPDRDVPPGHEPAQRDVPGGFTGDPDVLDARATSSLAPLLAAGWGRDRDLLGRVFPMDLRLQGRDGIGTELLPAVLRSEAELGVAPWRDVVVPGRVTFGRFPLFSRRPVSAADLVERYGADAVRYWAAGRRPGTDSSVEESGVAAAVGRRVVRKLRETGRFVVAVVQDRDATGDPAPLDRALLAELATAVDVVTAALDRTDLVAALDTAERVLRVFSSGHLELVKARARGEHGGDGAAAAATALRLALSTLLRLFAPLLPFVAEEVWSWWQPGSVHRASWPDARDLRDRAATGDPRVLAVAREVLIAVRRARVGAGVPWGAPVPEAVVRGPTADLDRLALAAPDVRSAGRVLDLRTSPDGREHLRVDLGGVTIDVTRTWALSGAS